MMDFDQAWVELEPGQRVRVSNGQAEPATNGLPLQIWRSHNHEGELVEKLDGPPRALHVRLDPDGDVQIGFQVREDSGDLFEPI